MGEEKSSGSRIVIAVTVSLVLYVLSIGPVECCWQRDIIPPKALPYLKAIYRPLGVTAKSLHFQDYIVRYLLWSFEITRTEWDPFKGSVYNW